MDEPAPLRLHYDEQFDTLEIFFRAEPALTVELDEDMYAHVVPSTKQVVGITIHHFREYHAQSAFPFQGILNPVSPRVARDIAEALLPA